jgi:23S rRNA (uridine2552-2'-O)-methyltransferase
MGYRRKDGYHRRARAEGYRARSAYKLAELDRRFGLLNRGDHVLDLGAWPGGWLQVVLERIGPEGRVVAIDLRPLEPLGAPNAVLLVGDVRDPATVTVAGERLGRQADIVLSDLAPKLTGVRATDETRGEELARATLALLPSLLRDGGRLVMKLFMTPAYEALVGEAHRMFARVTTTRPAATRPGSRELYVVAFGYHGRPRH